MGGRGGGEGVRGEVWETLENRFPLIMPTLF